MAISQRLIRIPPFTDPRVRRLTLRARDRAGRVRRRLLELAGSDRRSHPALFEMDRKLGRFLPNRDGFFVEAGAHNGYLQSNTYWFERFRGWRGVLVEPIPELYRQCVAERPRSKVFNYALVADDEAGRTVSMHYGGLMSLVHGAQGSPAADAAHAEAGSQLGWDVNYEVQVPGRTLSAILREAGAPADFDLLSLDVEGFEADALRGLDLDCHRPRFMLIEMRDQSAVRADIEQVIGARYEFVEQLSPYDLLYSRRS